MSQVFLAVGYAARILGEGMQFEDIHYIYPFDDPDEAMQFVEYAQQHDDDVDRWEIVTETVRSARSTYDAHRAWIKD